MNASQSKALLKAAINVRNMLAPKLEVLLTLEKRTEDQKQRLDTIRALIQAIAETEFPATPKAGIKPRKCVSRSGYGMYEAWNGDGHFKSEDDFKAYCAATRVWMDSVNGNFLGKQRTEIVGLDGEAQRAYRDNLKEQLSVCVCGCQASDHVEDKDGNLLTCTDCGQCDHFRSPVIENQVIELTELAA